MPVKGPERYISNAHPAAARSILFSFVHTGNWLSSKTQSSHSISLMAEESFCDFGVGTAEPSSFSNVLTSDPAFWDEF